MTHLPVASDPHQLARFLSAQAGVLDEVCHELAEGRKRTHWMWFVFPQLRGLGHSATAQHYGIASLQEAHAYLQHPLLGPTLMECTARVNAVEGRSAHDIFGTPDDLKFRSCMSLFRRVPQAPGVFQKALDKYFGGLPDPRTLELLSTT